MVGGYRSSLSSSSFASLIHRQHGGGGERIKDILV